MSQSPPRILGLIVVAASLQIYLLAGCQAPLKTLPSGLQYADLRTGTGAEVRTGHRAAVEFESWLQDGKQIGSSKERGIPFEFEVGGQDAIRGLSEGVRGMKVGGKRKLVVPPRLAYGDAGTPNGLVPPKATLVYEVEVVGVR